MYENNCGTNRSFSPNVSGCIFSFLLPHSTSIWLSIELQAALNFSLDTFLGIDFGLRNSIQKAAPSIIGTLSIISIVCTGDTPNAMRPAYDTAPMIPAPPVPDDHVDITFLQIRKTKTIILKTQRVSPTSIHLLVKFWRIWQKWRLTKARTTWR